MPSKTPKLGLNIWLENEVVNFEEVNDNFRKLEAMAMVVESGTITSSVTNGSTTWLYKKYSDGTIEMSTRLVYTNLRCTGGSKSPYYSGNSTVQFPFTLSNVYDVQMHLASSAAGWVADITGSGVTTYATFKVMATEYESTAINKQVYVNVKGVLADG